MAFTSNTDALYRSKRFPVHIGRLQTYEYKFEHSKTLQSLLPVKKLNLLHIKSNDHIVYHTNLFMIEELIKKCDKLS